MSPSLVINGLSTGSQKSRSKRLILSSERLFTENYSRMMRTYGTCAAAIPCGKWMMIQRSKCSTIYIALKTCVGWTQMVQCRHARWQMDGVLVDTRAVRSERTLLMKPV